MFSIITSLYNSGRYLPRFLHELKMFHSELASRNIELQSVIVANAPTGEELTHLDQLNQSWVKILRVPKENLYASWNRGIREAKNDHLGFWNVDDKRYSSALIEAEKLFSSGAELVYFPFLYRRYFKVLGIPFLVKSKIITPPLFDRTEFSQSMHCGPFFMFTRELYQKVGPFDESFKIAGDFEWNLRAAKISTFKRASTLAGEFINVGESLSGGQYEKLSEENQRIYQKHGVTSKIKK